MILDGGDNAGDSHHISIVTHALFICCRVRRQLSSYLIATTQGQMNRG
jgi:hypothetical protein